MSFTSLPLDIVHYILSYDGLFKLRNGKYMGQISKSDYRYELLLEIPREFTSSYPNWRYVLRVNCHFIIIVYVGSYEPIWYGYYFINRRIDDQLIRVHTT
jgi:hypothetical protein